MYSNRSPPKYMKLAAGGSSSNTTPLTTGSAVVAPATSTPVPRMQHSGNGSSTCRTGSSLSLHSNSSTSGLLTHNEKQHSHYHHSHGHHHVHPSHAHHGGTSKRTKKNNWGTRERAGMSFLIVIAFFAIFGLIILTEVFMIDERSHNNMVTLRHGSTYSGRMGDSMPDYDNVKDDYDLLDDNLLGDNKLGFVQLRDNKLKIQDADKSDAGRLAGILVNSPVNGFGGAGGGVANVPMIPWGKMLPMRVEETLPHYPVGTTPTDGSWQVVNGTRFKFFVFSAYYDRRDGKLVRVIGATKTRGPERVWCRFWYMNRNASATDGQRARYTSATVMARVKVIRENWNLKYSACFILCPVRTPEVEVPHYVSIVSRLRAPPGNLLVLRNTDWDVDFAANRSTSGAFNSSISPAYASHVASATSRLPTEGQIADQIAICVKPFHFNYDQALYLMEYLEFYALLGVSHFTFYNHTLGPHTSCVLQHYMSGDVPGNLTAADSVEVLTSAQAKADASRSNSTTQPKRIQKTKHYVKPTINILPWNLRMRSQKEIRTEGLFAALNDCLYRTMYRFKYLALVDLDEFIIPRHNDTLKQLLNSLNFRFRNRNTGAYSFQNAFFYLQFADDPLLYEHMLKTESERIRAALVTQRKTRRRFKLHPQKQRSKYVCKPEAVVEAGNHFVWEFAPGRGSLNVPPADAILQHYRVCEFGGNDCIKAPSVIDRTATKYVNRLVQRVETVYNHLKKRCDLPELPAMSTKQTPTDRREETKKYGPVIERTQTVSETKEHNEQVKATKTTSTASTATKKNRTATMTGGKTTANATAKKEASKKDAKPVHIRKPRKMVVFEQDEEGVPCARVEYSTSRNFNTQRE